MTFKTGDIVKMTGDFTRVTLGKKYLVNNVIGDQVFIRDDKDYLDSYHYSWFEKVPTEEESKPKTWGEMTPEEKGALLLAHHEGANIEVSDSEFTQSGWEVTSDPIWLYDLYYRVKPEPKIETVKRSLHGDKFMGYVAIDLEDGEPQWDTIRKWED